MISNITAENHLDTFRHLHQRKNKHGTFHLRSLTKHHGRRVETSRLWCDADCIRLRTHMSVKRQHKGSPQCARMRKKEQTNCYHRGSRCQFQSTVLLKQLGDAAVKPAWSHNIHLNFFGSSITSFSISSVACTVFFVHQRETCQRLCLTLSQAKWHLLQQRRQAL